MTSVALAAVPVPHSILSKLFERNHVLTVYGIALALCGAVMLALQVADPRTLASGVGIWVKPAKFFFSLAVFALTAAWFFGYVRPDRRRAPLMHGVVAMVIAASAFELAYICWQAAQGLESHFNISTPFHNLMYALMGVGAVLLVGTTLPMAWEIARRPAEGLQKSFVVAVVIALLLTFLLGGGFGGYMSSQAGHAVGAEGGGTMLFGWNRLGGDLRVAHFFGIHAEQAIPVMAALTSGCSARVRWLAVGAGSAAYAALTVAVFLQAIAGRSFVPL